MAKASTFVVLIIVLAMTHVAIHASSQPIQPTYIFQDCQVKLGNYTTKSTYERNLNTVLSELQDHASTDTFYSTRAGRAPINTVHGQYYCRGDVGSTLCSICIQEAAQVILTNCPLAKVAFVWYDVCALRYSNQSMLGIEAQRPGVYSYSLRNITSDQGEFLDVLNATMKSLIQEAVTGSNDTFAVGGEPLSALETVYCLVQCSPDLNATQCEACLLSTYEFIATCCQPSPLYMYVFLPSCQMMYDTRGVFYYGPNAPPPPPPMSFSPPPPPSSPVFGPTPPSPVAILPQTPPTGTGGSAAVRSSESTKLIGIGATTVLLLLLA